MQCATCLERKSIALQHRVGPAQTYTLYECAVCGVQAWEPRTGGGATWYENESLAMYRDMHADSTPLDGDARLRRFFEAYGGLTGRRVLDVGCGSGRLLWPLAQQGNEVWGIDFDSRSIEAAKKRGLRNVTTESAEEFVERALSENLRFDLVTAFDVVEHLADPLAILRRLRELLVPGGQIVVTVPNRERILVNHVGTDFPPHHFFRFDQRSLSRTLERAGYISVKCDEFDYGYSGGLVLDAGRRFLRGLLRGTRSRKARAPNTGTKASYERETLQPLNGRTAAYLRAALPLAFNWASAPVERFVGRGFKLYATAVRP